MGLKVHTIPALSDNFIYVVSNNDNEAFVVDPAEAEPVLDYLARANLHLNAILNTHHHWDHTGGNLEIKKETRCEVYGAAEDRSRIPGITRALNHDETFEILGTKVQVIGATGHTRGHILFYLPAEKILFSGDTLFSLGCGRLFEGSADQMWKTMCRIRELPKETKVYFGHEYTLRNGDFQKTIEPENPALEKYLAEVRAKVERETPSSPTLLETEVALNLFMRADDPELQKRLGVNNAIDTFAKIRSLKDQF